MKRRLCYVTGTRADFGLLERTLVRIHRHPELELGLCVTGMHLSRDHGLTVREVERSGLPIWDTITVDLSAGDGAAMATALAHELLGMVACFQRRQPEAVLVLGDRAEMLAGALAAIHLNIPVVHIHGGELSGTIDEPVRHAISKLSHYHFTATAGARDRLIRMGENPAHIHVTGAPGLDELALAPERTKHNLCAELGLDPTRRIALLIFHPVLQTAATGGAEMRAILEALRDAGSQVVCFAPNADAGNALIRAEIDQFGGDEGFKIVTHLDRKDYLAWLAAADVLVGNSSSGIIEAASFGIPVINVGSRQHGRERNANTRDVNPDRNAVREALRGSFAHGRHSRENIYGDGQAGERIARLLSSLPFSRDLLLKRNAY